MDLLNAVFLDIINTEDYLLLSDRTAEKFTEPQRKSFLLEALTDKECLKKLRFRKEDLPRLRELLLFPDFVVAQNGCKGKGMEGSCIVLRTMATKGRSHDLRDIFDRTESVLNRFYAWGIKHIYEHFHHLLHQFDAPVYSREFFDGLAQSNVDKGCVFPRCIGFLDGTIGRFVDRLALLRFRNSFSVTKSITRSDISLSLHRMDWFCSSMDGLLENDTIRSCWKTVAWNSESATWTKIIMFRCQIVSCCMVTKRTREVHSSFQLSRMPSTDNQRQEWTIKYS